MPQLDHGEHECALRKKPCFISNRRIQMKKVQKRKHSRLIVVFVKDDQSDNAAEETQNAQDFAGSGFDAFSFGVPRGDKGHQAEFDTKDEQAYEAENDGVPSVSQGQI